MPASPFDLTKLCEASRTRLESCVDSVSHDLEVEGFSAVLRLHFVKLDMNGRPKVDDLAKCVADHIIEYSFSSLRRGAAKKPNEVSRLNREARELLRKKVGSGESGEMLIYMLLEAFLNAPQMVAKLDLKTNSAMEIHGSDGIHMKWNEEDAVLDVYFAESKLYQDVASAVRDAISSIEAFHEKGMESRELCLVTSHFKWADTTLRDQVLRYVDRQSECDDCRVNHACLVGFDWEGYEACRRNPQILVEEYRKAAPRLRDLLAKRLVDSQVSNLRFDVFFLPFPSVEEFREAFLEAVQ